jgi:hypothetical protein
MLSLVPSTIILGLFAVAALGLVMTRHSLPEKVGERRAAARVLGIAVLVQGVHFIEEATTGLPEELPALFDLPSVSLSFFVLVNLAWIGIWIVSVSGLRSGRPAAFFAAWFLAIASMANAVLHPLGALLAGGYFPGLVSAPFAGLAGLWLWVRLHRATLPRTAAF